MQSILGSFAKVKNARDVFDAGRAGVKSLLTATKAPPGGSAHDRLIDLLAGNAAQADSEAHGQMVQDMIRIFESQRLISLQTLFDLSDNLESVSKGEKLDSALVASWPPASPRFSSPGRNCPRWRRTRSPSAIGPSGTSRPSGK